MLMMMCVVPDMLRCCRALFMQAIRRQHSGSPLQRHKQHEKEDHEFTHGVDCSLLRFCHHLVDSAAARPTLFDPWN